MIDQFIGKEVKFAAEPYHYGRMTVTKIEPHPQWKGFHIVHGTVVEGQQISRLFGASRSDPMRVGEEMKLYPISESALERGELRHIYPV